MLPSLALPLTGHSAAVFCGGRRLHDEGKDKGGGSFHENQSSNVY